MIGRYAESKITLPLALALIVLGSGTVTAKTAAIRTALSEQLEAAGDFRYFRDLCSELDYGFDTNAFDLLFKPLLVDAQRNGFSQDLAVQTMNAETERMKQSEDVIAKSYKQKIARAEKVGNPDDAAVIAVQYFDHVNQACSAYARSSLLGRFIKAPSDAYNTAGYRKFLDRLKPNMAQ